MKILEAVNLRKYYGSGENVVKALDGVSMSVQQGSFVAIVGASGSGKTTLLNMIGGLDQATSGKVFVNGIDLSALGKDELTVFRRRNIGFVFQNYNLIPILDVYDNIVLPLELDGDSIDEDYVNKVIDALGLGNKVHSLPTRLSGGQQQRVAIARALVTKPAIILADEPTGNLDTRASGDVLGLLKNTGKEFGQTICMITHNNGLAHSADEIVRMEDGKIV